MLLSIHPDNPDPRRVAQVVQCLERGGVIIYPTDAVYVLGCDLNNSKAVERVAQIKGIRAEKANFSLVCQDLSQLSSYSKQVNTPIYKLMRSLLPGPYTFILNATTLVPRLFKSKKKTIGIRVPDNNIPRAIVELLGHPIISTSIHDNDEVIEYTTDPELIYERYEKQVDLVIDGGFGDNTATTVIDCTTGIPDVIREGKGPVDSLF